MPPKCSLPKIAWDGKQLPFSTFPFILPERARQRWAVSCASSSNGDTRLGQSAGASQPDELSIATVETIEVTLRLVAGKILEDLAVARTQVVSVNDRRVVRPDDVRVVDRLVVHVVAGGIME